MMYYLLEPEVAGELGDNSEVEYEKGKIKKLKSLEYVFCEWQGDELLTTHPCFIISESLKNDIIQAQLKGFEISDIKVSFSDEYWEFHNDKLPNFYRISAVSAFEESRENLCNDFYFNKYQDLIVSERAWNIINKHKVNLCDVEKIN